MKTMLSINNINLKSPMKININIILMAFWG